MAPLILVVEDEPSIVELLKLNLADAGFDVAAAPDAETAQAALADALPDLVLVDWMLPGKSGLALAKELRAGARTRGLPIIMVTARSAEADKVAGLEAWVDDYVTKPFSPRELVARIKAVLRRRAPEAAQEPLAAGTLRLDPATQRVSVAGRPVRSARPNTACSGFCSRVPSASTAATSFSTWSGATTSTSRSARSTSTSGGFARHSSRTARIR